MSRTSALDFWKEMAVWEVSNQCRFANLSFQNINPKALADNDLTFSSIHSFLSHVAMVSKLLKSNNLPRESKLVRLLKKPLRKVGLLPPVISIEKELKISKRSLIHKRKYRNALEHYDEELKLWIERHGIEANIGTNNIGPKSMLLIPNMVWVTHYDPTTNTFTFVNEEVDLSLFHQETLRIGAIADAWIAAHH